MLFKNTASQGVYLFARDTVANTGKTGDAANITAYVSKDGGSTAETATSVAEVGGGMYWLALSQAETNANALCVVASSTTSNIVVDSIIALTTAGVIPAVAYGGTGGLPTYDDVASVSTGLALASDLADLQSDVTDIQGPAFVVGTHALDQSSGLSDMADAVLDEALSGHGTAGTAGDAMQSRYWFKFQMVGGVTTDKYSVIRFYRDATPITSGVTSPTLTVVSGENGIALIDGVTLLERGATHLWYYDATGVELATAGTAYEITCAATIDGEARTWQDTFVKTLA